MSFHYQKFGAFAIAYCFALRSLVRAYCVGSCIRPHALLSMYTKTVHTCERNREVKIERKKEKERVRRPHHETMSNLHIYVLARRRHLHAHTNTEEHVRLIYSTALFSTASRHGSLFLGTIVLFADFLINITSRFCGKKSLRASFALAHPNRASRRRDHRDPTVSVKVKKTPRGPAMPLRCHSC